MSMYFFILGRNPTLSIAEILNLGKDSHQSHQWQVIDLSSEVLVLRTETKFDCQILQRQLGGTIKIGEIISQIDTNLNIDNPDIIREICQKLTKISDSKKIYFGFSFYKLDESGEINRLRPQVKNLAIKLKQQLKAQGVSSRWVVSKEQTLSSVVVQKNKLLTSGAEFVFLVSRGKIYFGKTLSVQEFEEYSWRDYGRPEKSIGRGLIPPKLAKIMINLAFKGRIPLEGATLLDPFCGSGTIVQEAILLGYKEVVGADISEEAVTGTRKNLDWLVEKSKIKNQKSKIQIKNVKIFQSDVKNLSKYLTPCSIDAIVTEPYLGPIKVSSYKLQVSSLVSELSGLYLAAFEEFKKVLKPDGRIVIVFPVFKISARGGSAPGGKGQKYFLPILEEIKKIGWQIQPILAEEFSARGGSAFGGKKYPFIQITPRQSIIYSRPDQMVLREILIFRPSL